ncbi:hypothetical protein F4811DRAFT_12089 [Daldinia bambusicola]|nr:hypothetical protein F4811DRAFT_12089 [Daldinia bambusicola]
MEKTMQEQEQEQERERNDGDAPSKENKPEDTRKVHPNEQMNRVFRSLAFFDATKNDIFLTQALENLKPFIGDPPEDDEQKILWFFVNNRTDKVCFEEAQEAALAAKSLWFEGHKDCPVKLKAEHLFLMGLGLRSVDAPAVIEARFLRAFVLGFCVQAEEKGVNIPVHDNLQLCDADRGRIEAMIQKAFRDARVFIGYSPPIPSKEDIEVFTKSSGAILYLLKEMVSEMDDFVNLVDKRIEANHRELGGVIDYDALKRTTNLSSALQELSSAGEYNESKRAAEDVVLLFQAHSHGVLLEFRELARESRARFMADISDLKKAMSDN